MALTGLNQMTYIYIYAMESEDQIIHYVTELFGGSTIIEIRADTVERKTLKQR